MAASRSPTMFLRRCGLIEETPHPAPRLAPAQLLINFMPHEEIQLNAGILQGYEGDPAPDRGPTRPWPVSESV